MKIFKTVVFSLFALMFINAGLDKFFHYMPMPKMDPTLQKVMEAFVTIKWLMPLTGVVEVLSGILILISRTRALGAIMIFPIMVGILLQNITFMPDGILIAVVLFIINLWMLWDNKRKIEHLYK